MGNSTDQEVNLIQEEEKPLDVVEKICLTVGAHSMYYIIFTLLVVVLALMIFYGTKILYNLSRRTNSQYQMGHSRRRIFDNSPIRRDPWYDYNQYQYQNRGRPYVQY
eukprot:TRINITY_DN24972_c0_g1_i1.p1 TRINITY_DN24972_c0_g1~~TRINITY_DN24972_c0_g1_i1.p1  ORF type:complete len:107 (+),score=1.14 TRINITY_DN24972_c0_g1_i1:201-521(+)